MMLRVLLDNSVLQRRDQPEVADALERLADDETVELVSCPPQALEFCFSARQGSEAHDRFRRILDAWIPLELAPPVSMVLDIQRALWSAGKYRAAGSMETLIAGWALVNRATVVHYDRDYAHIASVTSGFRQEAVAGWGTLV